MTRVLCVLVVGCMSLVLAPAAGAAGSSLTVTVLKGAVASSRARDRALEASGRHMRRGGADRARAAIVGGGEISIERAPWQVVVEAFVHVEGKVEDVFCGGSILDATHILTAAHCMFNSINDARTPADDIYVIAGTSNANATDSEEPTQKVSGVESVRTHPFYVYAPDSGTVAPDDVAVLTVEVPFTFGPAIAPISLVATGSSPVEGSAVNLTGFGQENPNEELNGRLYSLAMTLGFSGRCGGENDALLLCASSPSGSPCSGDSGSPLTLGSAATLVGVEDDGLVVSGQKCSDGSENAVANVAAPEIKDFIEGSEAPPRAPRGGGVIVYVTDPPAGRAGESRGEGPFSGTDNGTGVAVGQSLACDPGTWSNDPTLTYTFIDKASGQILQQGASSTYTLSAADIGRTIYCEVLAVNAGGTAVGRTGPLPAVQAAPVPPPTAVAGSTTTPSVSPPSTIPESGSVSLAATSITVLGNGIALVKLNCLGIAECKGKLTLTAKIASKPKGKKKLARTATATATTIGTVSFSIAGDETKTVKVNLNAAGRTLLKADHGRCNASLTILELAPGAQNTQGANVRLIQEKATKAKG